jgi:hypothetical protein
MKTLLHFLGGLWIALGCLHAVYGLVNQNGLLAVLASPLPGTEGTLPFVVVLFLVVEIFILTPGLVLYALGTLIERKGQGAVR